METYDAEKAARVWARVRSGTGPRFQPAHLLALIAGEQADALVYLQLSRRYQGRDAATVRQLFEQEQSHAACLKGIYTLITGERPVLQAPPQSPESVEATLRRQYGREMHCLVQYEQFTSDGEYGPVFTRLAQQEREHCRILLELLGKLKA